MLWVKASGKSLANALGEDIFLPLDLAQVRLEIQTPAEPGNAFKPLSNSSLRPSIETTLHALMPHRVVLHSHAVDVIAHTLLTNGQAVMGEYLNGLSWQWIPYCRPGKPLTKTIATVLETGEADVLILANHGLVVGGDTPQAAERLQSEVMTRLSTVPRSYPSPDLGRLQALIHYLPTARLPNAAFIHALATDPWTLKLAQRNPAYPDHVVFCGVRPLIVHPSGNVLESVTTLLNEWGQDIAYVLIPETGVILLEGASPATEAMLQAQAEVLLRIPEGADVRLLSDSQCAELINWDAEKYRRALEIGTRS